VPTNTQDTNRTRQPEQPTTTKTTVSVPGRVKQKRHRTMQKQTAKANTDLKSKTNNNIRKKQLHKGKSGNAIRCSPHCAYKEHKILKKGGNM